MDFLFDTHLELFNSKEDNLPVFMKTHAADIKHTKLNQIAPRKKELMEKYQYFIHMIITRSFNHEDVEYNSDFLQDLFGARYIQLIETLQHLKYIERSPIYDPGKKARKIKMINADIKLELKYNSSFESYQGKHKNLIDAYQKDSQYLFVNNYPKDFVKHYRANLKQLRIIDESIARSYINDNPLFSAYQKLSYHWSLDEYNLNKFEIISDGDRRIYHLLTNMKKELKKFLNIKFQVDISNSCPLLYSYSIIRQYNISAPVLDLLYSININNIYSIPSSHYDIKVFRNLLKENNIRVRENNKIHIDELFYLYLTFHGKFWEVFTKLDCFAGVERSIIKVKVFEQVFYSNTQGRMHQEYATQFKKIFPNVFKSILDHRKQFKAGDCPHLAHTLMSLESELIEKVLTKMFSQGYVAVNIHDAIVVLDTNENLNLDPITVQKNVIEVYSEYNLKVNCKFEYFNQ